MIAATAIILAIALPVRPHQPDLRAQAPEHGSRVGRRHRPAAMAAGGDEADLAVLLHAEVDGLPPLVGLVVVVAARVDTEIAAEGNGDRAATIHDKLTLSQAVC